MWTLYSMEWGLLVLPLLRWKTSAVETTCFTWGHTQSGRAGSESRAVWPRGLALSAAARSGGPGGLRAGWEPRVRSAGASGPRARPEPSTMSAVVRVLAPPNAAARGGLTPVLSPPPRGASCTLSPRLSASSRAHVHVCCRCKRHKCCLSTGIH